MGSLSLIAVILSEIEKSCLVLSLTLMIGVDTIASVFQFGSFHIRSLLSNKNLTSLTFSYFFVGFKIYLKVIGSSYKLDSGDYKLLREIQGFSWGIIFTQFGLKKLYAFILDFRINFRYGLTQTDGDLNCQLQFENFNHIIEYLQYVVLLWEPIYDLFSIILTKKLVYVILVENILGIHHYWWKSLSSIVPNKSP